MGSPAHVYVGVELGGTKTIVATSRDGISIEQRYRVPTTDPRSTLGEVHRLLSRHNDESPLSAVGIGAFGPIDVRPSSPTFGRVGNSPKEGWQHVDIVSGIMGGLAQPVNLDTDVNAAVIAEKRLGAGRPHDHVAYMTVGTGIGVSIWSDGTVIRGANHGEGGHVRVERHPDDRADSVCPYHPDCLEGRASGTAMHQRWGKPASELGEQGDIAISMEAWYLAAGIVSLITVIPVDMVIVGGGVAHLDGLHERVSKLVRDMAGGYPSVPECASHPVIRPPALGDDAGAIGALHLATEAYESFR